MAEAPTLAEQATVQRLGQSAYSEPGRLSWSQREHETREMLALLVKIAERTGYAAGFREGHDAGRLHAFRFIGVHHLADAIANDLERIRTALDESGLCCTAEREP